MNPILTRKWLISLTSLVLLGAYISTKHPAAPIENASMPPDASGGDIEARHIQVDNVQTDGETDQFKTDQPKAGQFRPFEAELSTTTNNSVFNLHWHEDPSGHTAGSIEMTLSHRDQPQGERWVFPYSADEWEPIRNDLTIAKIKALPSFLLAEKSYYDARSQDQAGQVIVLTPIKSCWMAQTADTSSGQQITFATNPASSAVTYMAVTQATIAQQTVTAGASTLHYIANPACIPVPDQ